MKNGKLEFEVAVDDAGRPTAIYIEGRRVTGRHTKPYGRFETKKFLVEPSELPGASPASDAPRTEGETMFSFLEKLAEQQPVLRAGFARATGGVDWSFLLSKLVATKPMEWRCFHCGMTFTDESEAAKHFGPAEPVMRKPECIDYSTMALVAMRSNSAFKFFTEQIINGLDTGMLKIETPADETLAVILSRGRSALAENQKYVPEIPAPRTEGAEAVAWDYELASRIHHHADGSRTYSDFRPYLTSDKPNAPEGSVRNLRPLYAAPVATGREVREALRDIVTFLRGANTLATRGAEIEISRLCGIAEAALSAPAAPAAKPALAVREEIARIIDPEAFNTARHKAEGWKSGWVETRQTEAFVKADLILSRQPAADLVGALWHPFETAPKTGSPFLCFVPDEDCSDETGIEIIWWEPQEGAFLQNGEPIICKPTLWTSLDPLLASLRAASEAK